MKVTVNERVPGDCPGGEAKSELANGATVNATVSGRSVFTSSTAVQNLTCTDAVGLIAHPVCIVKRNVMFLYIYNAVFIFFSRFNVS